MSWDTFAVLLFGFEKTVFVAYFVLFLISVSVERKVSSVVISLMVLVLANGAMTAMTPILYQLATNEAPFFKFAWYGGFVLLDLFAVYLLYKFHTLLNQNVGAIAHLVGLSFCLLGIIQSLRYIDRYVFGTDWLQPIYQYGIPVLNVVLVPLVVALWTIQESDSKNSQVVSG